MVESAFPQDPVDEAARQAATGERRAVFRPGQASPWYPVVVLVPVLLLDAFILYMVYLMGMLGSVVGAVIVCAAFVVLPVAGMWIASKDARSGQELHIFDQGAVLRGPKGRVLPYRWADTRLLVSAVRRTEGATTYSYALLNLTQPPVAMGRNVVLLSVLGGATEAENPGDLVRAPLFAQMDVWGPMLEEGITRTHLPAVLAELAAGRRVEFGPAAVTADGLVVDGAETRWNEITALSVENGHLTVKRSGRFFRSSLRIAYVPNFLVLAAVVRHYSGAALV
jgi:hypothetical protein